jgi:hypothetical protein
VDRKCIAATAMKLLAADSRPISRVSSPNSLNSTALLADVTLWDSEPGQKWLASPTAARMEKPRGAGAMRDFSLHVEVGAAPQQMRGSGKPAPQEAHTRRLSVGRIARQLWFLRKVKGSLAEPCSEPMTTSIDCGFARVGRG